MYIVPFCRSRRACLREMFRSVSRMVFPSWRPMVISSRMSGMTVVFPSSSSMVSLNTAISIPGPFDSIRGIADGQLTPRVNFVARDSMTLFYEDERRRDHDGHAQDERRDDDGDRDVLVLVDLAPQVVGRDELPDVVADDEQHDAGDAEQRGVEQQTPERLGRRGGGHRKRERQGGHGSPQ